MNSLRDDVRTEIATFFAERYEVDPASISDGTALFESEGGLGVDSLDLLVMAQILQEKYAVNVDDERLAVVRTIGEVIDFIEFKLAEAA